MESSVPKKWNLYFTNKDEAACKRYNFSVAMNVGVLRDHGANPRKHMKKQIETFLEEARIGDIIYLNGPLDGKKSSKTPLVTHWAEYLGLFLTDSTIGSAFKGIGYMPDNFPRVDYEDAVTSIGHDFYIFVKEWHRIGNPEKGPGYRNPYKNTLYEINESTTNYASFL